MLRCAGGFWKGVVQVAPCSSLGQTLQLPLPASPSMPGRLGWRQGQLRRPVRAPFLGPDRCFLASLEHLFLGSPWNTGFSFTQYLLEVILLSSSSKWDTKNSDNHQNWGGAKLSQKATNSVLVPAPSGDLSQCSSSPMQTDSSGHVCSNIRFVFQKFFGV